ncbi:hypothetical protein DEJ16_01660 [Curtobacterium sp. MCJR17_055]|uniref:hypothetical protein n=1 Tax=unclassified Curtobacterium TaxID=257496 RepID=UPI000D87C7F9|nr:MULTISPECIES: hypothetical protein [unclassified Curtobacterium]PYY36911.1 hypothetical protein DEI87_04485 [Curtobacterium sp. MCBD17_029]PYY57978.1 hypothetical protein DEJ26_10350 [Curtobacterium sp. MCPF17_015]PYY58429.1 hypothetical protein DEJ16_01660 [Curtobacterium sp. MCJR17_055]WIB36697.1 hypothetical protein DEJ15_06435 [Curtobacterium sp. MCJR17_043]
MTPDRFRTARWAVAEEFGDGRWRLTLRDEADDELGAFGLGVEGPWDPDVEPHVAFVLVQLGLALTGTRPWREDELGDQRAPVLPLG